MCSIGTVPQYVQACSRSGKRIWAIRGTQQYLYRGVRVADWDEEGFRLGRGVGLVDVDVWKEKIFGG